MYVSVMVPVIPGECLFNSLFMLTAANKTNVLHCAEDDHHNEPIMHTDLSCHDDIKRRTCVITGKNAIYKTSPYTKYCKITLRRCLVNLEDTLLVVGDEHFYSPNILGKDAKGSYFCIHSYFLYLLQYNVGFLWNYIILMLNLTTV